MKAVKRISWMKLSLMLLLAAMLLVASACGSGAPGNSKNGANSNLEDPATATGTPSNTGADETDTGEGEAETAAEATAYPLTVKDGTGTELVFAQAPARIVTLVPSETEIAFAIGAGEQVVGVDDFSNYPEEAAGKEKIGGMEANIEKIVSLKPDLVLASSGMNQPVVDKLRSLKLTVYASDPKTYDDVASKITQIGVIMDKAKEAAEVTRHMQDVRQQVTDAVKDAPKPNVFLEFSPGWTVGKGEFLDELLTIAGGTNIADQQGWYEIDPESVVKSNPDAIIYASMAVKEGEKNPILAAIESRPGWNTIAAVKEKKIYEVNEDPLVRVGPRLAEGLLEVANKLHPDLVK
ncbi:ABC transporter substrate-binding protein [Paenibacillus nasutitermitis]|uniref:ABC transporter substrate-binding lipoprotein YvrC n=1 Tax=Paenibacillus nasutitermitis TaxID=1652958 RepID=A0A916YYG6_9BACL|nr:ABC transporter substrate-binding protein [Paenibacillus nasutitermitis]GGD67585.1 putative ABC transporter substrate-binding lipoprotein YvrC [Paenibacillus nasutitermitis]